MDAIHGLVEPNLRRAALAEPARAEVVSEAVLRAAIEAEDVARAEAVAVAAPRGEVIGWLLHAATDHFLDYGHALLFALSAGELLDHAGDADAAPVLAAVARGIALGTREDRLPYMRAAMRAFEPPFARLDALWAAADGSRPAPLEALVAAAQADAVEDAVDAVTAALESGADPRHVALALGAAAARRLLDFDAALEDDEAWREGWLDVTHVLTFAEGVHRALVRCGRAPLLRGVYQAARFIQHVGPIMRAPDALESAPASCAGDLDVARAIAERRVDAAPWAVTAALARGAPVEAELRAASLAGRAVLPIFTAHHVKTTAAALRLSRALTAVFGDREEARWPLMAAARFLAAPLAERRLHRRVRDARRFVIEGRRAPTRLGYS